ncbi:hypothetical protein BaRGS_00019247, partial [Batillaria attramentaria]
RIPDMILAGVGNNIITHIVTLAFQAFAAKSLLFNVSCQCKRVRRYVWRARFYQLKQTDSDSTMIVQSSRPFSKPETD